MFGIIVVYNKHVDDSATYQCLKAYRDIQIIVCDNSTKPFQNKDTVLHEGHQYLDMQGNGGLSKAYNRSLDLISEINPQMDGYVILFDDDTFIPEEYLQAVSKAAEAGEADIFLPIVEDEIGILSPSVMKKYYCHRAPEDVWSIPQAELCGINSGMAVKLEIFKDYRYDERIFLDYVDHNFLRDMRKRNKKVQILDARIKQTFSSNTDSKEKAKSRFQIYRKDIFQFYQGGFLSRSFYYYSITRRKMKLAWKYRDLRLLLTK